MRLERPLFPRRAQDSGSHFHLVVSNNIDIEMLSLVYRIIKERLHLGVIR